MIKAIIFDCWDTILDNGTSALKEVRKILGVKFDGFAEKFENAFMKQWFKTEEEGFRKVCMAFGIEPKEELVKKLAEMWRRKDSSAKPYSDTIPVLSRIRKKYKTALISNTDCFVHPILKKYSLEELFDVVKLSCDSKLLKPDKKLFEAVCEELGVKKDEAVMVGDSLRVDIMGAKNAGLKYVLIDRKCKSDFSPKIKSLKELEKALSMI